MGLLIAKFWKGQMIINNISSPDKSLYVIGAGILVVLKSKNKSICDPAELFDSYKNINEKISISYFFYALDWLYIVGLVELTKHGDIKLCN